VNCPSCGTQNAAGKRFCKECGTALALVCPECGAALVGDEKFCGECVTALTAEAAPSTPREPSAPAAERRLVSVLFADLRMLLGQGRPAEALAAAEASLAERDTIGISSESIEERSAWPFRRH
jgi:hypothetical protein